MSEMRVRETGHDGFLEVMEPRIQNRGTGVTVAKSRIATTSQHSLAAPSSRSPSEDVAGGEFRSGEFQIAGVKNT